MLHITNHNLQLLDTGLYTQLQPTVDKFSEEALPSDLWHGMHYHYTNNLHINLHIV